MGTLCSGLGCAGLPCMVTWPTSSVAADTTCTTWSVYSAGLLTMLPLLSTTSLSRVLGAGGENCQCKSASPAALPQNDACATRKSPVQPPLQLANPPDAYANEPGSVGSPRKIHWPGPLHVSFCSTASKVVE